jgi:hypothetical protein
MSIFTNKQKKKLNNGEPSRLLQNGGGEFRLKERLVVLLSLGKKFRSLVIGEENQNLLNVKNLKKCDKYINMCYTSE